MSKLTAQEAFEKLKKNLSASGPYIQKGVEAVTENPMDKAAAKADKWIAGLQDAYASGKWVRGLGRTDLTAWKKSMIDKGIGRINSGIAAAEAKVVAFYGELFPFQENLATKVHAMSDVSLADSEARMVAWMRGMAEFKRT